MSLMASKLRQTLSQAGSQGRPAGHAGETKSALVHSRAQRPKTKARTSLKSEHSKKRHQCLNWRAWSDRQKDWRSVSTILRLRRAAARGIGHSKILGTWTPVWRKSRRDSYSCSQSPIASDFYRDPLHNACRSNSRSTIGKAVTHNTAHANARKAGWSSCHLQS